MGKLRRMTSRRAQKNFSKALVAARLRRYTTRQSSFRPQPEALVVFGAIAQLGERFNGIEEVVGSIPSGSTNQFYF